MKVNKIKLKLSDLINRVNQLPEGFKGFNPNRVKRALLKYFIFIEEFEQNKDITEDKIKNELFIINEYLDIINEAVDKIKLKENI
jgi:hypothetical protein